MNKKGSSSVSIASPLIQPAPLFVQLMTTALWEVITLKNSFQNSLRRGQSQQSLARIVVCSVTTLKW